MSNPELLGGRTSVPAAAPAYVWAAKVTEPSGAELFQKSARGPVAETVELMSGTDVGAGDGDGVAGCTATDTFGTAGFGAAGSGRSSATTKVTTTAAITPATSN